MAGEVAGFLILLDVVLLSRLTDQFFTAAPPHNAGSYMRVLP